MQLIRHRVLLTRATKIKSRGINMNVDKAFLLSKATLHQRGMSGMELSVQVSSLCGGAYRRNFLKTRTYRDPNPANLVRNPKISPKTEEILGAFLASAPWWQGRRVQIADKRGPGENDSQLSISFSYFHLHLHASAVVHNGERDGWKGRHRRGTGARHDTHS